MKDGVGCGLCGSSADSERRVTRSLLGVLECRVGVRQQKRIVFVCAQMWETRVGDLAILSRTGEGDGRLERVAESISNHPICSKKHALHHSKNVCKVKSNHEEPSPP